MEMKYTDITKVVELDTENSVNEYLSAGWVLLATYTRASGYIGYSLGWPSTKGEPVIPLPKRNYLD